MKRLTKKRTKAVLIDGVIAGLLSFGVEQLVRKKVKSEFVHAVITPTLVSYALEACQMRRGGQTLGYKLMGLELKNDDGTPVTAEQAFKRALHRDTRSIVTYIKDRAHFEAEDGAILPHDAAFHMHVTEKN
ncbi:RDD family protein [Exiguobacterium sp. AM39-5BH]|uniref:RDD family protein n=1 Tax=Exiguobacterium sp. AM39-5BH TaxID=2292355 RepID=UPI000FE24740|nr:RDD family protein [Exiguobacterium sp. AM39-5BH]RHB50091.1 RDD family protein [Exiguobacterium sp. AM39-5BH]